MGSRFCTVHLLIISQHRAARAPSAMTRRVGCLSTCTLQTGLRWLTVMTTVMIDPHRLASMHTEAPGSFTRTLPGVAAGGRRRAAQGHLPGPQQGELTHASWQSSHLCHILRDALMPVRPCVPMCPMYICARGKESRLLSVSQHNTEF